MEVSPIKHDAIKNLHLLLSVILIIPIALVYGLYPRIALPYLFVIKPDTINLANIFRAMMGLYLGIAAIWIAGMLKPIFWITATWTNIMFMGGLALGRLLSLAIDRIPSPAFMIGLVVEIILAVWGLKNLQLHHSKAGSANG